MHPTEAAAARVVAPRGPLGRDFLVRFVPVSILLHLASALPWAAIIAAVLKLLGVGSSVHWKEDNSDHPTVIPIDLDQLDPGDDPPATAPTGPGTFGGMLPNGAYGDAGPDVFDAQADASDAFDSQPSAPDAPLRDAGDAGGDAGDGSSDAEDADGGSNKKVKDPSQAAGGLVGLKPTKGEVNVKVFVRFDHLRAHPIGRALGAKFANIEQWKPFFKGTGIDPVTDLDALLADGPRFYETSRVTVILAHSKSEADITLALKAIAGDMKDASWVGDDDVPALKGTVDGAVRVFIQIPAGLIVTPADGEKPGLAIAHAMVKQKKTAKQILPKGDDSLIVSAYIRKPSNVLSDVPEDLTDVEIAIHARPDEGAILDLEGKAKDEAHAKEDAEKMRKLIESHLTGLQGAIARKWVDGYKIETDGDLVRFHHELSGEKLSDLYTLLQTLGVL